MGGVADSITASCEAQIQQFKDMEVVLGDLVAILSEKQRKIKEMPYGEI